MRNNFLGQFARLSIRKKYWDCGGLTFVTDIELLVSLVKNILRMPSSLVDDNTAAII